MLANTRQGSVARVDSAKLEEYLLTQPQAECPVVHHFGPATPHGPGTYVREVTLRAGLLCVGHAQRFAQQNIMLTGRVAMVDADTGAVKILEAPHIFVGTPGRKMGYVLENCTWLNVFATDETDVAKLEEMFFDKSAAFEASREMAITFERLTREGDRQDFAEMLLDLGVTAEQVRQQSLDQSDLIDMPPGWPNFVTGPSAIEGTGAFAPAGARRSSVVAPARLNGKRTPAGRFVNHAQDPNCMYQRVANNIYLVAKRDIRGSAGGDLGEELTVDYRQAVAVALSFVENL